jgi:hypothetical protein
MHLGLEIPKWEFLEKYRTDVIYYVSEWNTSTPSAFGIHPSRGEFVEIYCTDVIYYVSEGNL